MFPLNPRAFALSLAMALATITALGWLAVLILPQVQFAHRWLGLFTEAPVGSIRAGTVSIAVSFAACWFSAFAMATVHNRLIKIGA
jgi:hypothetical protein